ncbi:aminoacyl-tRNA hydrolase [Arcanobacterium haemolyticum]|nr:aminoacyl-tRNA hydrolase [Arcanobacterium haemolyticum]
MYVVVGLGNPGAQYAATRHNAGHMVIDELARRTQSPLKAHKASRTHAASVRLGIAPGERAVIATCDSYMNTSGGPTNALVSYYDVPAENLIVVHDELDLPFGTLKLKRGGGEGGHNGLKSISTALGAKNYIRLRFGIGRPPGRQDPADYVLKPFASTERDELAILIQEAADAVEDVVVRGLEAAQLKLHSAH